MHQKSILPGAAVEGTTRNPTRPAGRSDLLDKEYDWIEAALNQRFLALRSAMDDFAQTFKDEMKDYKGWVMGFEEGRDSLEEALRIYTLLEYADTQHPNSAVQAFGVLVCSPSLAERAEILNVKKDELRIFLHGLRKEMIWALDESSGAKTMMPLARYLLTRLGLARLHQKQTTRRLQIVYDMPTSIGFTWAKLPAITRITRDEALIRLERCGDDENIMRQIAMLDQVRPDEPLAIVIPQSPKVRCNLTWMKERDGVLRRIKGKQITTGMPILVVGDKDAKLPRLSKTTVDSMDRIGGRTKRSDIKIDDRVFLPSIHAHRYLDTHKERARRAMRVRLDRSEVKLPDRQGDGLF